MSCQIINDIRNGRLPQIRARTMFSPGHERQAWVSAPSRIFELRAAGNGTYNQSGGFVFGTGTLGMAMIAGSLIGNAISNSNARARALADAQVAFRWHLDASLHVTNDGFILHTPQHVLTWQILCPYAELLFVLWALAKHPDHPQLADGSWLVPGWLEFARSQGRDPRLSSPILTRTGPVRLPARGGRLQLTAGH